MRLTLLGLTTISSASAFAPAVHRVQPHINVQMQKPLIVRFAESSNEFSPFEDGISNTNIINNAKTATATVATWATSASVASAAGPDWGIFEGRTGSLLHPVMMASLLLFSLSTGFLGLQWRRQRTIPAEISSLKKTIPNLNGASSLSAAIVAAKAVNEDGSANDLSVISAYEMALPVEKQIKELTAERKELATQGNRDKHFNQGAMLAFLGTAFAVEGPLNTYARAGKLFPGPHLYAGASLVVLWAAAAACVPAMQKGSDTARSIHIGANAVGTGLFAWQVVSGIPIFLKVLEKTQWP